MLKMSQMSWSSVCMMAHIQVPEGQSLRSGVQGQPSQEETLSQKTWEKVEAGPETKEGRNPCFSFLRALWLD